MLCVFFHILRQQRYTHFPYTTLFRSEIAEIYQKDKILSQSLPALKIMMNEVGLCGTKVLLPFTQLNKDEEEKIRKQTRERSEEHTSELQSRPHLVCRLLLEKKNKINS